MRRQGFEFFLAFLALCFIRLCATPCVCALPALWWQHQHRFSTSSLLPAASKGHSRAGLPWTCSMSSWEMCQKVGGFPALSGDNVPLVRPVCGARCCSSFNLLWDKTASLPPSHPQGQLCGSKTQDCHPVEGKWELLL